MSRHTPGPWQHADAGTWKNGVRTSTEYFVRRPDDDVGIANDILDPETSQPSEANAHLIAAAPELLEALKNLVSQVDENSWIRDELAEARAAIAKAEGKQ